MPWVMNAYHFSLAFLGALIYGFPSRRLTVIGVTGTKGKTTTANLIAQILEAAGYRTGLATTVLFRVAGEERVNDTKQTMLGRFGLQKLLREMVRAGCTHAVVETSSEGILQYRHRFVDYDAAVFTNLTPEHIERHGSFENYRDAKVRLFEKLARKLDGIGVYNLDDPNAEHFFGPRVVRRYGFAQKAPLPDPNLPEANQFRVSDIRLTEKGSEFKLRGEEFQMPLVGEFNVMNAAAAIVTGIALGVSADKIRMALESAKAAPGRLETLRTPQGVLVVLDYAHEPASLEALYQAVRIFKPKRVIGLLGAQGGGRDVWKRAEMGRIAARHADEIVVTDEDPYDEPPEEVIRDVAQGARGEGENKVHEIPDRREGIKKALELARKGDAVVLSGKGGEVWMCVARGKKIPWSDRAVVEELIK